MIILCYPPGKLYIIVEYCQKGSLLSYLRSKRKDPQNPLSTKDLIDMAHQVTCGMEFLGSKNVSTESNIIDTTHIKFCHMLIN